MVVFFADTTNYPYTPLPDCIRVIDVGYLIVDLQSLFASQVICWAPLQLYALQATVTPITCKKTNNTPPDKFYMVDITIEVSINYSTWFGFWLSHVTPKCQTHEWIPQVIIYSITHSEPALFHHHPFTITQSDPSPLHHHSIRAITLSPTLIQTIST